MKKLLFFTLLLSTTCAFTQTTVVPSFVKDSLDIYVNRALQQWQIPGVAVAIVKNGEVVLMKGYGVKDLDTKEKVTENSLFMIGSNSKAFTGTAIAMLDAEKKLSLEDNVTKWLPTFALKNKAAGEMANVRDLLCHRIGFRTFQGDFTYWTSNLSRSQVIEKMSHINAAFPFRNKWGYTNASFVAAGEIIPQASGLTWEDFVTQKIFKPLEMNHTLALSKDFPGAKDKCTAYTLVDGHLVKIPHCQIDNLAAAGSIGSSVNDMSHWLMMQLDNGKYKGQQVIPAAAINETRRPASIMGNNRPLYNTGHFRLYGLGWMLEDYCGKKIVSHTGGVNGFVTSVTLIPEEKLGIIVLTNTDQNSFYEALKWEIMDAYLGNTYRNYSNTYLGYQQQQTQEDAALYNKLADTAAMKNATALPLKNYTGNYFNEVYGNMEVVLEKGSLRMNFEHHPNMYAALQPLGNNRFYAIFSDPEFSKAVFPFEVTDGKVTAVTVKVADFIEYDAYVFTRK
ncbi:MAG: hypothetical protein RL172_1044 [Bacteroidota bacterium]|jgi:CubicO group peptidase (beta-lactamase class C family)